MSRVLVVDDEASICWALREFLGDLGHEVEVASSAEEGLDLDLRTLQRLWRPWSGGAGRAGAGRGRLDPPGRQDADQLGEKVVLIAIQPVKVQQMTALVGHSHGFIADRHPSRDAAAEAAEIWDRVTDLGPHDHTRSTRLSDLSDGTHHRVGAGGRYGSSRTGRKIRCAAR